MGYKNIDMTGALLGSPGHKGGNVSFKRAGNDIRRLLEQRTDSYVTTFFDFYGIHPGWPGQEEINALTKPDTATKARIMGFRDF